MPRKIDPEWDEARRNEWSGKFTGSGQRQAFIMTDKTLCREFSLDNSLPKWMQLAYHVYAMVSPGKTEYFPKHGEVAAFLGLRPGDERSHIQLAIQKGMLGEGSTKECLVLPGGVSYLRKQYQNTDPETNTAAGLRRSLVTEERVPVD